MLTGIGLVYFISTTIFFWRETWRFGGYKVTYMGTFVVICALLICFLLSKFCVCILFIQLSLLDLMDIVFMCAPYHSTVQRTPVSNLILVNPAKQHPQLKWEGAYCICNIFLTLYRAKSLFQPFLALRPIFQTEFQFLWMHMYLIIFSHIFTVSWYKRWMAMIMQEVLVLISIVRLYLFAAFRYFSFVFGSFNFWNTLLSVIYRNCCWSWKIRDGIRSSKHCSNCFWGVGIC